ncbi:MAG: phosphate acyltransferase [Gemmatimonadales bacterium]
MTFREAIRERAAGRRARLVLPEGRDPRVQHAAEMLDRLGIAVPIVIDAACVDPVDDQRVVAVAAHLRRRRPDAIRDGMHALDLAGDPLRFAASLVALGEADGCVAGAVTSTADVLRAALWAIGPRVQGGTVSSAMYLGMPDGRTFTFTDIAVVPSPSPAAMADAGVAAARDRTRLVGDAPVVAFLSFATHGSADGPAVEHVREAVARFRTLAPDIRCDGPLQVDAAIIPAVAAVKCGGSPVAGSANVLVFPSLDAANIGYKLVQRLGGATAAGPLLQGLARPLSDLSRGATPDDIVDVAAMVALQSAPEPSELQELHA